MKAIFCHVENIRPVPSRGVTSITIELPLEMHVELTSMLYGKDALITLAPEGLKLPYGVAKGEDPDQPAPQIEKAGKGPYGHWYSCLYPGWFQSEAVRKAFAELIHPGHDWDVGSQEAIKNVLYESFGVDSLSWIKPADFAAYIDKLGLYWTLPTLLRVKEPTPIGVAS